MNLVLRVRRPIASRRRLSATVLVAALALSVPAAASGGDERRGALGRSSARRTDDARDMPAVVDRAAQRREDRQLAGQASEQIAGKTAPITDELKKTQAVVDRALKVRKERLLAWQTSARA